MQHFDLENIESLPNKEELKASGFLEKKSAISTIADHSKELEISDINKEDASDEEKLEDFIADN